MKKLGVIGGMGPEATCYFYGRVTAYTRAQKDQEHIDVMILSHASIPDRTEAILTGKTKELIRLLREDAKALETLGASNIAVTCNTAHYFYDEMQEAVGIPVINMISESVAYAAGKFSGVKKIGIIGTDGTICSGVYDRECEKRGIEAVKLSKEGQRAVMSLIYDDIKSGGRGEREKMDRALNEFEEKDCGAVILACTELSVFKSRYEFPSFCLDALDVLAKESVLRSEAEYREV